MGLGSSSAPSPKSLNGELSLLQQHGLCILGHHPTYIEFLFSFVPSVPKSNFSEPEQLRVRYILYCTNRIDSFFKRSSSVIFFEFQKKECECPPNIWQVSRQASSKQKMTNGKGKLFMVNNWRSFIRIALVWVQRTNGKFWILYFTNSYARIRMYL